MMTTVGVVFVALAWLYVIVPFAPRRSTGEQKS
jgi:hypothetical protein